MCVGYNNERAPEKAIPAQEKGAEESQVVEVAEVELTADAEQVLLEYWDAGFRRLLKDPLKALEESREPLSLHHERDGDTAPV